jgi:hypothetical protein
MKTTFFALALLAHCFSATAADKAHRTTAITQGRSIGLIRLGDDLRTVERRYGNSTFQDAVMGGRSWEMWKLGRRGSFEVFFVRPDTFTSRVNQIRTTSFRFSTPAGLRVGSSLADVRRAYSHLQLVPDETSRPESSRPSVTVYDAVASGIAFEFQAKTCTAIIVHQPKSKIGSDIIGGHFSYESK